MRKYRARVVCRSEYYKYIPNNVSYVNLRSHLEWQGFTPCRIKDMKKYPSSDCLLRLGIMYDNIWNYFTYDPLLDLISVPSMYQESLLKLIAGPGILIDFEYGHELEKVSMFGPKLRSGLVSDVNFVGIDRLPLSLIGQYNLKVHDETVLEGLYIGSTKEGVLYLSHIDMSKDYSKGILNEYNNFLKILKHEFLQRKSLDRFISKAE